MMPPAERERFSDAPRPSPSHSEPMSHRRHPSDPPSEKPMPADAGPYAPRREPEPAPEPFHLQPFIPLKPKQPPAAAKDDAPPASVWSCAACTYNNPPNFLACEICESPKNPDDPGVRKPSFSRYPLISLITAHPALRRASHSLRPKPRRRVGRLHSRSRRTFRSPASLRATRTNRHRSLKATSRYGGRALIDDVSPYSHRPIFPRAVLRFVAHVDVRDLPARQRAGGADLHDVQKRSVQRCPVATARTRARRRRRSTAGRLYVLHLAPYGPIATGRGPSFPGFPAPWKRLCSGRGSVSIPQRLELPWKRTPSLNGHRTIQSAHESTFGGRAARWSAKPRSKGERAGAKRK